MGSAAAAYGHDVYSHYPYDRDDYRRDVDYHRRASVKVPTGFEIAGITAGVKRSGRPDLGAISAAEPLNWAYAATTNLLQAPCVSRNRLLHEARGAVRAVVVNSGNANCANGEQGERDNDAFAAAAAAAFGVTPAEVLTASTGVIGQAMPLAKLNSAMPKLASARGQESEPFAKAILTTDTTMKKVGVTLSSGATLVGVTKGSGMIAPNMATMLAFVMTDAAATQEQLREMWPRVMAGSFNQLTVDGDTSTNDMALLLSSNLVPTDLAELEAALLELCAQLARLIARDGEGATKLMTVRAVGAHSQDEARRAALTVASSSLVKAAVHGADPNWGRIVAAVGRAGVRCDMSKVTIKMQGYELYRGAPLPFDNAAVSKALQASDVLLEVSLAAGEASGEAWGCDLSAEYVRINADYTT